MKLAPPTLRLTCVYYISCRIRTTLVHMCMCVFECVEIRRLVSACTTHMLRDVTVLARVRTVHVDKIAPPRIRNICVEWGGVVGDGWGCFVGLFIGIETHTVHAHVSHVSA